MTIPQRSSQGKFLSAKPVKKKGRGNRAPKHRTSEGKFVSPPGAVPKPKKGWIRPPWMSIYHVGPVLCPMCLKTARVPAAPDLVRGLPKGFVFCSKECAGNPLKEAPPFPEPKRITNRRERAESDERMGFPPLIGAFELNLKELNQKDEYEFTHRCQCLSHQFLYGHGDYEWTSVNSRRRAWRNKVPLMRGLMCAERAEKAGVTELEDIARNFGPRPEGMSFADWALTESWNPFMTARGLDLIPPLPPPMMKDGEQWPDKFSCMVVDRSRPPRFIRMRTEVERLEQVRRVEEEKEAAPERVRLYGEAMERERIKADAENAARAAQRKAEREGRGEPDPTEVLERQRDESIARQAAREAAQKAAEVALPPVPPRPSPKDAPGFIMTVPRKEFPR